MSQTQQRELELGAGGPWTEEVLEALRTLLAGEPDDGTSSSDTAPLAGAALHVTDPAAALVYSAPLARMFRLDTEDAAVLWIRPIAGQTATADDSNLTTATFSLSEARRRSLAATSVVLHRDPDTQAPTITAELRSGQQATITAAAGNELRELAAWDTFTLTVLSADDEVALDALSEDSWHGPHA